MLLDGSILLRIVGLVLGSGRRREVRLSLLGLGHDEFLSVAVLTVQVTAVPMTSASAQTSARSPSCALCTASLFLSLLSFALVVRVVGVVRILGRGAEGSPGIAPARSVFASVSMSAFFCFTLFAFLVAFSLFSGSEEATGNLFEELVGDLLSAVAEGLEGQGRHLSMGAGNPAVGSDVW